MFFFWLEKFINGILLSTVVIPTWCVFWVFFPYETVWTRLTAANFPNIMTHWECHFIEIKWDIILPPSNINFYYHSINRFCNLFLLTKDMTAYLTVTLLISRQKVTRLESYFLSNTFVTIDRIHTKEHLAKNRWNCCVKMLHVQWKKFQ